MDDIKGAEFSLPPFDVVVCSSWLAMRKCQCPAHIAQSAAASAAVHNDQVPVAVVDQPVVSKPAFELRIHCRQVVEHFNNNATPSHLNPSPRSTESCIPCRVKDGRVYFEYNHFINGIKVTSSVVQGQPFLSTLDVAKNHPIPRWRLYGISRIEPEVSHNSTTPSNKVWLHVQTNDLPPTGPHFTETVLKHVTLDFYWTSTSSSLTILYTRLSSQHGTTNLDPNNITPNGHSLETMAMMTGLDRILFALAQSHPLIFSSKRILWFCNTMRDNRRIVFSLLGIYRNASSPEMKVSMTQSIQRIRRQYSSVPQGDTHLLLETVLEAIAYKTVMNETTKSRTTTTRIGPRRDLIPSIPIPKSTNNTDANAEMRETIATNVTDNDAREPWSTHQKQQQSEKEDEGKGTNEEQQQQEEAKDDDDGDDDDAGDYFPSSKLPPLASREPSHVHQHFLFISSYSFNNNTTKINNEQGVAHVPDCNTSPNVGDEICERTDLALNHGQNQNQQQRRRQRQECLELDLEMDEWRSREQDEQGKGDQSDFSDFNDFSEEEQNQLFEEDRGGLVDEDEGLEMWKERGNKSGSSPYLPTHNQVSKE